MPLVLERKQSEAIHLGSDVIITVVQVQNGRVKLAITAPKSLEIWRSELIERDRNESSE